MTSASTYSEDASDEAPPSIENGALEAALEGDMQPLPEKQPPVLDEECLLHGRPPAENDVTIVISQLALKQVDMHSRSDLQREVGGVLLGYAYHYDGGIYLDVRAAIPAVSADHGPVHFTFTADAWSQLHQDRAGRYPDLDMVGWFHTHPNLGVFYSSDDVVVHSAAFTLPWHVGMVVDPLRKETAFFGWREGSLVPIAGFYERLELEPQSLLPWQPVASDIWDHPYEYNDTWRGGASSVYLAGSHLPALPGIKSYLAYGLAAAGFLLSLLLLLAWVLPLTREVDRLQNMVIVLADSALANSNAALCPDPRLRLLSPLAGQRISSGSATTIIGTAMLPELKRYQLDARPLKGEPQWATVDAFRGSTKLDDLGTWNTTDWPAGSYELRLSAVDSNNIRLPASPECTIPVELLP
ncbi:MAG: Mov34/MPN/PAD-1 family protein [Candidatus Promineifilaceae bacterium]